MIVAPALLCALAYWGRPRVALRLRCVLPHDMTLLLYGVIPVRRRRHQWRDLNRRMALHVFTRTLDGLRLNHHGGCRGCGL